MAPSESDNDQTEHAPAPEARPVVSSAVEVLREMIATKERELDDLRCRLKREGARFGDAN